LSELKEHPLSQVEPLRKEHITADFDCDRHPSLNEWLKRHAWTNQQGETSRTYVVHRGFGIAGYYSIATGNVRREDAAERIRKGLAQHPIPVILLTRLAIDRSEQGKGLGKALLKNALLRIAQAADIVGARAVLVHAIDDQAKRFYQHFEFVTPPVDDLHLMLLMKDLRAMLSRS
jgi:GNAT superfamily N-acetyltransferase